MMTRYEPKNQISQAHRVDPMRIGVGLGTASFDGAAGMTGGFTRATA